jgi:type II secretion system protein C
VLSSLTIRRAFWLLDVALVAGVVILAWQAFIAFTAPPPDISTSVTAENADPAAPARQHNRSADYYAAMGNSLIFGDAGVVPGAGASSRNSNASSPGSLDSLPATSLTSLTLLGTAVGTEEISSAVIEDGAQVKVYWEGDKVAGSAVVEQILPNKVVLNRDGTREVLTSSVSQVSSVRPTPPTGTPTARTPPARVSSRPGYTIVDRAEWQDRDPYEMIGQGKVTPAWRNGQVEGLQLQNIGDNEYAQRLGLQEGDVVRSVNGVRIRSMEEAMSLAQKLQQAPVIRVEVMRGGKTETLTYRMR